MSYPPSADPWFYDETDFIECKVCGREYDHNEYDSFTCLECENEQTGEASEATIPSSV
jgi:ribosomal protein S27E